MTRRRRDGPTGRDAFEEIERRLGDVLGEFGEALKRAADAADRDEDAAGTGPRLRTHVDLRVGGLAAGRAGPHDAPRAETPAPVHEIHEDDAAWTLVAELPGADEADLEITLAEGRLAVSAGAPRPRRLEVPAPAWLRLEALERRLVNGILELRAPRPTETEDPR